MTATNINDKQLSRFRVMLNEFMKNPTETLDEIGDGEPFTFFKNDWKQAINLYPNEYLKTTYAIYFTDRKHDIESAMPLHFK